MAVQAVDIASGEKTEVPGTTAATTNGAQYDGIQEKAQHVQKNIIKTAEHYGTEVVHKSRSMIDFLITPEQRATLVEKAQRFIHASPKLAAFLGLNLVLTGIPLVLFIIFAISTLLVSLLVAVVTAVLIAVTFTLFSVGAALLVVLPTVLLTTFAACTVFIWGLAIFYVYRLVKGRVEQDVSEIETDLKRI